MIGHGVAIYGAADRYLGMLAATLGEWELRGAALRGGARDEPRDGRGHWLAHTAYEFGRMLLARGGRDDRAMAGQLLGEAAALAERIGMRRCSRVCRRSGRRARTAAPGCPTASRRARCRYCGLVARGLSNREIGRELVISEHTAANHIRSILRKTGSANRTEAASYAHRHGLAVYLTGATIGPCRCS